ncbi:MAG: aminotransferase class I/II-fold pyridoxal phosphate-dependent enzyme, partial [Oscillospiraceae bacterium]|nr:aminotransferase class I/II-fold pyridoxal phosphate-dependent enzyme [Oscillospiraceae bacterium]
MYYLTENPHGGSGLSLDFSANTNPLGPPPGALTAARAALEHMDRYPDPHCRALTRAIAAHEGVPEDRVLCGNGAAELIYSYCAALKPRRAAELAPTFSEYSAALALHGGTMLRCFLPPETDFLPDAGLPDFLRETKPEALFLCNPNNPTGRLIPSALLDEILALCGRLDIRLFVDECFLALAGGRSLRDALAENPHLLILNAFTKTYGMAGLRLGWCLSADRELLAAMAKQTPPWNVSSVAQAAGTAALAEEGYLPRARALIEAERPRLAAELSALGLRVRASDANFLLLQGPEPLGAALRARGSALRDCSNFPGLGAGWYRCAVRSAEENQ